MGINSYVVGYQVMEALCHLYIFINIYIYVYDIYIYTHIYILRLYQNYSVDGPHMRKRKSMETTSVVKKTENVESGLFL